MNIILWPRLRAAVLDLALLAASLLAVLALSTGAVHAAGSTKTVSPATLADRPYTCPVPSGFVARDWAYVVGGVNAARNRDYYIDQATKKRSARVSVYTAPSRQLITVVPEVLHPEWPESVALQDAQMARRRAQFAAEFEQWQPCLGLDAWQALLDDYAAKLAAEKSANSTWKARTYQGDSPR
jgi:hypothetical protein